MLAEIFMLRVEVDVRNLNARNPRCDTNGTKSAAWRHSCDTKTCKAGVATGSNSMREPTCATSYFGPPSLPAR